MDLPLGDLMSKWKETLAKVAPTVANMLGGPLAGMAVTMATQALGIEPSEKAIEDAIATGDPNILLKLKQVESDVKVKLKELDIKELESHQQDRDSAREREAKVGGYTTSILAFVIIVTFFAIIAYVLVVGLNATPAVASMIGMLVGMVSSKAEQVVNYYFGSSAGSRRKNVLIQQQIEDVNKGP